MEIGLSVHNMLTYVNRIVNYHTCEGMCDHFKRNKVFTLTCNFCTSTHIPELETTKLSLRKFCSVVCLQETFVILLLVFFF